MTTKKSSQDKKHINIRNTYPYLIISAGYLLLTYVLVLLLDDDTIVRLTEEDSYFESVGAVYWLVASVLFFVLFVKYPESNDFHFIKTNRNIFYFLLGCLFFVGFGEEISWGQRIFGFQTPELLDEINMQQEVNIHNLWIFHGKDAEGQPKGFLGKMTNIDRLFSVFWFTYCFLIPIANRKSAGMAGFLNRIALPIGPIWMGSFFVLNYLISKIVQWTLQPVVEIKEHNFAFLFVVLATWFAMNHKASLEHVNIDGIADE